MLHLLKTGKLPTAFGSNRSSARLRLSHKILFIPLFLILFPFSFSLLALSPVYSQVTSPAFDPNCYFPKIGVPGEIDTIYGAQELQYLGANMLNIGSTPDSSYGRMSCGLSSNPDSIFNFIFTTGPSFNLHKLNVVGYVNINPGYIIRRGHFRSPKYSDILYDDRSTSPARIYWQDDQGNYDSSRYTILLSSVKGKIYNDYSPMIPYTSYISSDSVEDIISTVFVGNTNTIQDSIFLIYFKGGEQLRSQGRIANQDSIIFLNRYKEPAVFLFKENQGDFRGIGRNDLLASDNYGNIFYYKNERPFSMANVVNALRYDTLYAQWENPQSVYNFQRSQFVMKALSKVSDDSSEDLFAYFNTIYGSNEIQEYRIFKGGKDFGSRRWTSDSAAFILHEPYYYDSKYHDMGFGALGGIRDCGHMTGTNNRVLYIEGSLDGGFYGYEFFYVLGDAIDDKVDMFIGPIPNGGGAESFVDTLVADNDNLQDIIMGESGFGLDVASATGSIYIVHGSNKIPDKTNSVSARKAVDESPSHILAYPNPCDQHTVLTFDNCSAQQMQVEVVSTSGKICLHEETPAVEGLQQFAVDLSTISAGEYIINVSCPAPGWSSSVKVIKTGAAVTPWTFDLKRMVGR